MEYSWHRKLNCVTQETNFEYLVRTYKGYHVIEGLLNTDKIFKNKKWRNSQRRIPPTMRKMFCSWNNV